MYVLSFRFRLFIVISEIITEKASANWAEVYDSFSLSSKYVTAR
jgi:hypothetical protein